MVFVSGRPCAGYIKHNSLARSLPRSIPGLPALDGAKRRKGRGVCLSQCPSSRVRPLCRSAGGFPLTGENLALAWIRLGRWQAIRAARLARRVDQRPLRMTSSFVFVRSVGWSSSRDYSLLYGYEWPLSRAPEVAKYCNMGITAGRSAFDHAPPALPGSCTFIGWRPKLQGPPHSPP